MEPGISAAEPQRRLREARRDYEAVKARIREVGFICEGSLVERHISCGKPNCRCTDPDYRHGPYHQLSWKEHGRTVSRRLTPDEARLYQEWINNRRQLDALLAQMRAVSAQAGRHLLEGVTAEPTQDPDHPRQRPRSGN